MSFTLQKLKYNKIFTSFEYLYYILSHNSLSFFRFQNHEREIPLFPLHFPQPLLYPLGNSERQGSLQLRICPGAALALRPPHRQICNFNYIMFISL